MCLFIARVYGGAAIPPGLAAMLPASDLSADGGEVLGECVRVVAEGCEGTVVTATGEHGGSLRVDCSGPWAPLCGLISPGSQLNLVRPREVGGLVVPELVVFEPDYLVDISAVAACFESYGATPYTYLINKIKPSPLSSNILLGNFAGQLLDEAVHGLDCTYADSAARFFRNNALALAAKPARSSATYAAPWAVCCQPR